ncbi:MAG: DNA-3-methyladenine glycosylase 2 family protein [Pseudomonadota bacterium]
MVPLTSDAALAEALDQLVAREPRFGPVRKLVGHVPLRRAPADFEGLAHIICGQQVSKAAASAIWARFKKRMPDITPATIDAMPDEHFIESGFSRGKQATIRGLASHVLDTGMDLGALIELPAEEAEARLTALKGIGPWTAQCYLLFCGGHRDVFPAGDIALQQAALEIFNMRGGRPDPAKLTRRAKDWRPVRAAAARLLWTHYNFTRGTPTGSGVEAI